MRNHFLLESWEMSFLEENELNGLIPCLRASPGAGPPGGSPSPVNALCQGHLIPEATLAGLTASMGVSSLRAVASESSVPCLRTSVSDFPNISHLSKPPLLTLEFPWTPVPMWNLV